MWKRSRREGPHTRESVGELKAKVDGDRNLMLCCLYLWGLLVEPKIAADQPYNIQVVGMNLKQNFIGRRDTVAEASCKYLYVFDVDGTSSCHGCVAWKQRRRTFTKQSSNKALSNVCPDNLTSACVKPDLSQSCV